MDKRQKSLWQNSSSHGVSWDTLDEEYLKFKDWFLMRKQIWNNQVVKTLKGDDKFGEDEEDDIIAFQSQDTWTPTEEILSHAVDVAE